MCFIMLNNLSHGALYFASPHRLTCKMPLLLEVKKKKEKEIDRLLSRKIFT